jgi:predicted regulator of Ras-like GTPase activity (Roadblock/LC7/MglB family)
MAYEELVKQDIAFCIVSRNGEIIESYKVEDYELIENVVRLFNTAAYFHSSLDDELNNIDIVFNEKKVVIVRMGGNIAFGICNKDMDSLVIADTFSGKSE